jgi:nitric oxide reductase large subunit
MTYASQRVAYPYFVVALLLFTLQVALGLWLGIQYAWTAPQGLVDAFPFATARAMHTNLLVLWLLLGFMGATFYLVPEEAERELAWPRLAIAQLVLLVGTGVAALVGFAFGWFYWWWVIHLWVEGAWELIAAAITAFVLIKLTGVDRRVVERWLYVELGLFLFTGIAGTGHHYYWLGAPRAWLWVGGCWEELRSLGWQSRW